MTVLLRDLADTSAAVAGTPARLGKVGLLADVLGRADPDEAAAAVAFLSGELRQRQIGVGWATLREVPPPADSPTLLVGELRQGALEGVMVDAVARAAGVPAKDVRRAVMLRGDLGVVATAALAGGTAALAGFRLEVGRPVLPMLAQTADSVDAALAKLAASADNPAA